MDAPRRFLRESIHKKLVGKAENLNCLNFPPSPLIFYVYFHMESVHDGVLCYLLIEVVTCLDIESLHTNVHFLLLH